MAKRKSKKRPILAKDLYGSTKVKYPAMPTRKIIELLAKPKRAARAIASPPRADVNLNVPCIHQLWDTPDDFHGGWACGPTSVLMVLAYYGLLEARPIQVSQLRSIPAYMAGISVTFLPIETKPSMKNQILKLAVPPGFMGLWLIVLAVVGEPIGLMSVDVVSNRLWMFFYLV